MLFEPAPGGDMTLRSSDGVTLATKSLAACDLRRVATAASGEIPVFTPGSNNSECAPRSYIRIFRITWVSVDCVMSGGQILTRKCCKTFGNSDSSGQSFVFSLNFVRYTANLSQNKRARHTEGILRVY